MGVWYGSVTVTGRENKKPMIKNLDHVNIVVSSLENAEGFFRLLGFEKHHEGELSGPWISEVVGLEGVRARYVALSLPGDRAAVELIRYDAPPGKPAPEVNRPNDVGYRHLAFAVEDLEGEVRRLREAGVEFMGDVRIYPETGKKLVYFQGPDRIILELAEYPGP